MLFLPRFRILTEILAIVGGLSIIGGMLARAFLMDGKKPGTQPHRATEIRARRASALDPL